MLRIRNRQIVNASGKPVILSGYYPGPHPLVTVRHRNLYKKLFPDMARYRLSFFRHASTFNLVGDHWMHPYKMAGGRFDLNAWNEGFFSHWRDVFRVAADHGIVIVLPIFRGPRSQSGQSVWPFNQYGQDHDYFHPANNVSGVNVATVEDWYSSPASRTHQRRYFRRLAAALKGFDNIIFEVANEPRGNTDPWQRWFAGVIKAEAPGALVIPADLPEHRSLASHRWPSAQNSLDGAAAIDLFHRMKRGPQPALADNDCCVEHTADKDDRIGSFVFLLAGAHPLLMHYSDTAGPNGTTRISAKRLKSVSVGIRYFEDRGISPFDLELISTGNSYLLFKGEGFKLGFCAGGDRLPLSGKHRIEWFDIATERKYIRKPTGAAKTPPRGAMWMALAVPEAGGANPGNPGPQDPAGNGDHKAWARKLSGPTNNLGRLLVNLREGTGSLDTTLKAINKSARNIRNQTAEFDTTRRGAE